MRNPASRADPSRMRVRPSATIAVGRGERMKRLTAELRAARPVAWTWHSIFYPTLQRCSYAPFGLFFVARPDDSFRLTAARINALNASSSIASPSRMSIARLVLPSRLELKRPEGSSNEAPLAKVIFTTFLYVSPVQMIPACDHTGTPLHFHSSITSGSACLMRIRTRASVSPRQSLSSLILASIS